MTVKEYISQKFQSFGISVSDADILDMAESAGLESVNDERNADNKLQVSVAVAKFIPSLLLRATSVSESGFSMSWNIEGLKSYYAYLCKQYGLTDEINTDRPKIKFWQ